MVGVVGVAGFEPAVPCAQGRWDGQASLHPSRDSRNRTCGIQAPARRSPIELHPVWSGWQESDLLPPGPGPGALPMSYNPHVEMAGIEPATATLAKRARSLAVIPRCPQDGACGPYLVLTLLS